MTNNPKNGMPSTLCECGYWNDWQKAPGAQITIQHRWEKWEKPYQCVKCKRQLKRAGITRARPSASDQIGLYGQRQLSNFKVKK